MSTCNPFPWELATNEVQDPPFDIFNIAGLRMAQRHEILLQRKQRMFPDKFPIFLFPNQWGIHFGSM